MPAPTLNAFVHAMRYEAEGVVSVELRPAAPGVGFPPFEAGSHIDLHLPNGLVRNYSLCNPPGERDRYVVAVLHEYKGRGGSRCVHEQLRVGDVLPISAPRNNFVLHEESRRSVLVAGGIGITPIFCMLQRLVALGRGVDLIYCVRSRKHAAFATEIEALGSQVQLVWHFDDERGAAPDLARLLSGRGTDSHYYCCGPAPMLEAFEQACRQLGHVHAHIERFTAPTTRAVAALDGGFEVVCKKSERSVMVSAGQPVLDALLEIGLAPAHSCRAGVCGSCETAVLDFDGELDHQDGVLSLEEQRAGKTMMICVSRCTGSRLVLDI